MSLPGPPFTSDPLPARALRGLSDLWPIAPLLTGFGAVTVGVTTSLLTNTGRFSPALVSIIAMAGWAALALALVSLPFSNRLRFGALALFIVVAVALPMAILIMFRWKTGIPLAVNDGMFQTEVVTGNFLAGHDPYGTDFTRTSLLRWYTYVPADSGVLHHFEYYPLVVLVSGPVVLLERFLNLGVDLRPIILAAGAAGFLFILKLDWSWRWRYAFAVLLFLDPAFAYVEGRNDILWLAPVIAALALAQRSRWFGACLVLGIAAAFKLFAMPFVVFLAALLWFRWRRGDVGWRTMLAGFAALVAPLALTMTPFLIWNPGAFWNDTIGWFVESPSTIPVYGLGLGEALLILRVIPNPMAPFPFGIIQAALALPLAAIGLRRVARDPSIANLLAAAVTVLSVVVLCGRFTNSNYLAALLLLFGPAIAASRDQAVRRREGLVRAA